MARTVGNLLKEQRVESGLTQLRAAELLGVEEDTLGRYERDKLPCPPDILAKAEMIYDSPGLILRGLKVMSPIYSCVPDVIIKPLPMAQLSTHSELEDVIDMRRASDKALSDGKITDEETQTMKAYCKEIWEAVCALVTLFFAIQKCLRQKKSPLQRQRAEVI